MVPTMYRYGTCCPFPGFWEQRILEEHRPCCSPCSLAGWSQREGMLQGWVCRRTLPLLGPSCHILHPHHKKKNVKNKKNKNCNFLLWIPFSKSDFCSSFQLINPAPPPQMKFPTLTCPMQMLWVRCSLPTVWRSWCNLSSCKRGSWLIPLAD